MVSTDTIKKNHEFRRLYNRGKSKVSPYLAVYVMKRKQGPRRLGITVSTKVGCAVIRNRVRRRIREAFRLNENRFDEQVDIIVVARVRACDASFAQLEKSLLTIAEDLGILKTESIM